jgi:hypothetical protein
LNANTLYRCDTSPTRGQSFYSDLLAQHAYLTHIGFAPVTKIFFLSNPYLIQCLVKNVTFAIIKKINRTRINGKPQYTGE